MLNSFWLADLGKRVSAKTLEEYQKWLEAIKASLNEEQIYIHFRTKRGSWADLHTKAAKIYDTLEEAEAAAAEQSAAYDKVYLAGENQFNCGYCQKAVDNDKKVNRELIYQGRCKRTGKRKVVHEVKAYCSDLCGGNDQMGHEG